MIARVPVRSRGVVTTEAIVDAVDEALVVDFTWRLHEHGYAIADTGGRKNRRRLLMHRVILAPPPGLAIDHINRNPLDNRRANLRLATQAENCQNVPARGGKSPYRGVFQRKGSLTWFAQVKVGGVQHHLGTFATQQEAAAAAAAFRAQHMPFSTEFVSEGRPEEAVPA